MGPRQPASAATTASLDGIGRRLGLTRSSLDRDLLRHYERLWAPFREEAFDLLEVGFGRTESLQCWLEWFPNARVVGLDVRVIRMPGGGDRLVVRRADQADPQALVSLIREFRFRIVIDDGSREFADQQALLSMIYPAIEPGGFYCVESVWDPREDAIDPESPLIPPMYDLVEQGGRALSLGQHQQETALINQIARQTATVTTLPRAVVLERKGAGG